MNTVKLLAGVLILAALAPAAGSRAADGTPLPGTKALTWKGDIASRLVEGVDKFLLREMDRAAADRAKHWRRDTSSAEAYNRSIGPNRKRLAHILGVRDKRVAFEAPELVGTTVRPSFVGRGDDHEVYAVRWPAFGDVHGEGLLLVPKRDSPVVNIVAIPDAGQTPEQIAGLVEGVAPESQYARRLAASGCRVIVPVVINRRDRISKLTNREFLYRPAFELGRHLIGYEVQKILACVDWLSKDGGDAKIGVIGWGEGGAARPVRRRAGHADRRGVRERLLRRPPQHLARADRPQRIRPARAIR